MYKMATALASMLFDPVMKGLGETLDYSRHLKSEPMTLDRVKDIPGGFAAFGAGFIGRHANNNVSNSGRSQMIP